MRRLVSFLALSLAALLAAPEAAAQDISDLRAAVEEHYAAIAAGDMVAVAGHHAEHFTGFLFDNGLLWEYTSRDAQQAAFQAAADAGLKFEVQIRQFDGRIIGNTGLAYFYLVGTLNQPDGPTLQGTWRVTEVWVREGNRWREAHHHDSPLQTGVHPRPHRPDMQQMRQQMQEMMQRMHQQHHPEQPQGDREGL